MNGHAAAYSNFRRIEGSVTVSPAKFACQTSDMTGVAFWGDSRFGCPASEARRITPQSVPSHVSQTLPARPPASGPSSHGCPGMDILNQPINLRGHHEQVSNQPGAWIPIRVRRASRHKNGRARHGLHYILPHPNTQRALENIPGLIIVAMEVQGSDPSRRPRRSVRVLPLGDHEICTHGPHPIFPPAGVQLWEKSRSNFSFRSSPTSPLPAPTSPASSGKSSPPPADQPRRSTPL
jgi:hypothetical protein